MKLPWVPLKERYPDHYTPCVLARITMGKELAWKDIYMVWEDWTEAGEDLEEMGLTHWIPITSEGANE